MFRVAFCLALDLVSPLLSVSIAGKCKTLSSIVTQDALEMFQWTVQSSCAYQSVHAQHMRGSACGLLCCFSEARAGSNRISYFRYMLDMADVQSRYVLQYLSYCLSVSLTDARSDVISGLRSRRASLTGLSDDWMIGSSKH